MRIVSLLLATLVAVVAPPARAASDVPVSPVGRLAASPDVAAGVGDRIYVAWVDRGAADVAAPSPGGPRSHAANVDVMVAVSTDGARTFGPAVRANDRPGQVWSFTTSRPRIALARTGTLHVLFTGNDVNAAGKPVIVPMYTRSIDGGRSFEPARRLATVGDGDLSGIIHGGYAQAATFGTLVVDSRGGVHAYWIDTRFMRGGADTGALVAVHSTDDGRTFGAEQVLDSTGACPCCQLTAAAGADARVYLGMRVADGGYRDSTVRTSRDRGRTFEPAVRLGDARWQIDACPLKPTAVAVDATRVYAAAFHGAGEPAGLRFAASSDGGRTFGAFRVVHPAAAVSDYPAVVALPNGRVQVYWHAKLAEDPARAVFGAESTDAGATFGAPVRLVSGAAVGYPSATTLAGGEVALTYVADNRVYVRTRPDLGATR